MTGRFMPRPHKRWGSRIPVHVMRRFFNFLGDGRCQGIATIEKYGELATVEIHFSTKAEAAGFYRSLRAIYEAAR